MKIFIGESYPEIIFKFLKTKADIIKINSSPTIKDSTASHADMQAFFFDNNTVVTCMKEYEEFFSDYHFGNQPQSPYPNDILYNAVLVGENLFCNIKYTEKEIIRIAKKRSLNIINVNQGYAKCSTIPLSENKIITSDKGIHKRALENNIHSLLVSNNGIYLEGYKNGFMGGCAVALPEELIFLGDITKHQDYKKITDFANRKISYIPNFPLYDCGITHI